MFSQTTSANPQSAFYCGRFRHLFLLNKWHNRDEYIIVIMVLREKMGKIMIKKLQKVA